MSKMNWEHRNKMQKVYDGRPSRGGNKRRAPKGIPRAKKKIDSYQGLVKLVSKFDSTCADCTRSIKPGDPIWWYPEGKWVLHDYCFEAMDK